MFKNSFLLLVLSLTFSGLRGQALDTIQIVDDKYLEDQFYAGVSYNFLTNRPENVELRNLSYSIQLGFIKDIPLNAKRNFGIGLGLGYAANSYYSNIGATEESGLITYEILNAEDFDRSKFETHSLDFPFEVRWRTSNAIDYKFWRVYAGFKASYLFSRRSRRVLNREALSFSNSDIEQWQYGLTLNFGYNTWNIHLFYSLNNLLAETATLEESVIAIKPLRVSIIFYIL